MENKFNLSYSLINAFWQYSRGESCGLLFKAIYLDKTHITKKTDIMQLGLRFEYDCIGSLDRDGKIPEQVLTSKSGLSAKTKHLIEQVKNFENIVKYYKIKWTKENINLLWFFDKDRYKIEGHPDLPATMDTKNVIIDLKTTGGIDDKWGDYGWHKSKVVWRKDLKLQSEMYQLLFYKNYNIEADFYYFVFANNNSDKCKTYHIKFDIANINALEADLDKIYDIISFQYAMDSFEANPEKERCKDCPLNKTCEHFTNVPKIETISIE